MKNIEIEINKILKKDEKHISNVVDYLISSAIDNHASDIHLEPLRDSFNVRYRIDGVLHIIAKFPKDIEDQLISRLKVISKLVIYKKKIPQDGRIVTKDGDLRISFLPAIHGEKAVIRVISGKEKFLTLNELGLSDNMREDLQRLLTSSQGMILLTGPAGSGKTTTIYAGLKYIYDVIGNRVNITTCEDPIEHDLGFATQTQVNPAAGFIFSQGLRSILRQDPDVIMLGEIRDKETAEIAIQSGFTGHLVITTIHSGLTTGVFSRLINMGSEPYQVASAITGILAQRLIRVLCPKCREEYQPSQNLLQELGIQNHNLFFRPRGCRECGGTGYKGRTGLFELLIVSGEIEELIAKKVTDSELRERVISLGMKTLKEDGIRNILEGITSPEEVMRVIQ
ncbi:type II/IV secretion system protein [Candidatus Desantisbacteria bacterium]|nr:type II/IV secretion system protein [Candidatus Desantisbacteria bacterium]